jgi:lysozyme family protein
MAASKYPEALRRVLVHEGGYANHPDDPGGETMKGVTYRVYHAYRQRKGLEPRSVRFITDQELQEIYRLQYWNQCRADDLPPGVDYVVFDGAVNSGPKQSILWLQRALGLPVADGTMGEATLAAVSNHIDHDALIAEICRRRMGFLRSLRTWGSFGKGWTSRVSSVQAVGQAWASGSVGPQIVASQVPQGAEAKARPQDISQPHLATEVAGPATTASSPLADPIMNSANQLQMFGGINQYIMYVVIALILVGLGLTIYAVVKNKRAKDARSGEAMADVPNFTELEPV